MMNGLLRWVAAGFGFVCLSVLAVIAVGWYMVDRYSEDLPEFAQLADYEPPVMTRFYAGDGRLLAEYAIENRVFVPIEAIPRPVINAFLSAEDKNFYDHPGIDALGVVRAVVTNLQNFGSGRRLVGASTITQQVAKNFLLTSEVSVDRKIKEAILAFRMEEAFSKERLLELYLNEIYLGYGSYGVAAAALNYFNRSLDELTIAEIAFLAALPKAPNNYDPMRWPEAALDRRNWVISRMEEDGHITAEEAAEARAEPLVVRRRDPTERVTGDYFAEEVRRELVSHYGDETLYEGGLAVRTTLEPRLQQIADRVLREGLEDYDRRHGWRGPLAHLDSLEAGEGSLPADWRDRLVAMPPPGGMSSSWRLALVTDLAARDATVAFADDSTGTIPLAELAWARPQLEDQSLGEAVRAPADVLAVGDVVAVEAVAENDKGEAYAEDTYGLRQIPNVEGALVALDPHTGRVLAMSGGYAFERSVFNRATQAKRQPGSAFKPIVYLAALEAGYTPATMVLDAPFVMEQGPGLPEWRPSNYSGEFYGLTTMRVGIEKSRNLVTVRLAQSLGMDHVVDAAMRFGLFDDMPPLLSYSLGAGETTLMRLTTAYAMLVNGGRRITPSLIDRVQDRFGNTVMRFDDRPCPQCEVFEWANQSVPEVPDPRERVTDAASAYQVVSMLQGVVLRGTGSRVRTVGKPVGGKTGTTNDSRDAWFVGFSPDLAVGVFVGFDEPTSLGRKETGSSVAAPIFRDFMTAALEDEPATPFRIPPGIRLVRINPETGRVARRGDERVILEAFKPGTVPTVEADELPNVPRHAGPATGTGGLY